MDLANLKRLGQELQELRDANNQKKKEATLEAELQRLRELSPKKIREHTALVGKFKGKPFESLFQDETYVEWVVTNATAPAQSRYHGMKQVLILLDMRMREELLVKDKGAVLKSEGKMTEAARGSDGSHPTPTSPGTAR